MADDAGIDFLLPIGRWKGYGGDTDLHGETLETITWATGLLAATRASPCSAPCTRRCSIRSSPPSRFVTADHIGEGRFGLNIVAGWNEGEFEMFGVQQREHETRYAYAQEWIDAIKLAWGPDEDFDFDGELLKLKKVRAKPKPYGGTRPLIMNAGSSRPARPSRCATATPSSPPARPRARALEATAKMVQDIKAEARAIGREIEVFTVGQVICRPTQKEADDYYQLRHHRQWPTGARSSA